MLVRLVYASVARPKLGLDDLRAILETAVERNAADALTGVLCYADGAFLQALEGERAAVNRVYNRICRDGRHARCELLLYCEIEQRMFGQWSMKLVHLVGDARYASALLRLGHRQFEPRAMTERQVTALLVEIAALEQRMAG